MSDASSPITSLLARWSDGDAEAFPALMELAYDDLRAIAHRRLVAAGRRQTLATTELVHEAFIRLDDHGGGVWHNRARFYAFASRAMRHILVDRARARRAEKRGGEALVLPLEEASHMSVDPETDVLHVEEVLQKLATRHRRMASIIELRFFGGFSVEETAAVLETSVRTVEREWTRARAYLMVALTANDTA